MTTLFASPRKRVRVWRRSTRATWTARTSGFGRAEELLSAGALPGWFAGRELVDALAIRLAASAGHAGLAADRFQLALAAAEPNDAFATASLVAECCQALLDVGVQTVAATVERVRYAAIASGFDRVAERLGR